MFSSAGRADDYADSFTHIVFTYGIEFYFIQINTTLYEEIKRGENLCQLERKRNVTLRDYIIRFQIRIFTSSCGCPANSRGLQIQHESRFHLLEPESRHSKPKFFLEGALRNLLFERSALFAPRSKMDKFPSAPWNCILQFMPAYHSSKNPRDKKERKWKDGNHPNVRVLHLSYYCFTCFFFQKKTATNYCCLSRIEIYLSFPQVATLYH